MGCTYIGRHRKGGIEYVQIQAAWESQGLRQENTSPVRGEIPRECWERITGQTFVAGQHNWIRSDHAAAIRADRHYRAVSDAAV